MTEQVIPQAGEKMETFEAHPAFAMVDLTSIHRMPQYATVGLYLFEKLLDSNVREAEAAAEVIDLKPVRQTPISSGRRRRSVRTRANRPRVVSE